jgi:hypothetical protein
VCAGAGDDAGGGTEQKALHEFFIFSPVRESDNSLLYGEFSSYLNCLYIAEYSVYFEIKFQRIPILGQKSAPHKIIHDPLFGR